MTKVKKYLIRNEGFKCSYKNQVKVKMALCDYIKTKNLVYNAFSLQDDQIIKSFADKYLNCLVYKKERKKETYKEKALRFYKSDEWRRIRYQILREQGGKCQCCGRSAKDGVVLHVDHIVPLSKDWNKRLDKNNLQVLCEDCNLGKSNTDFIDWRFKSHT